VFRSPLASALASLSEGERAAAEAIRALWVMEAVAVVVGGVRREELVPVVAQWISPARTAAADLLQRLDHRTAALAKAVENRCKGREGGSEAMRRWNDPRQEGLN
jgi:hypothetical protein